LEVDLKKTTRISFLDVPVDLIEKEYLFEKLDEMVREGNKHQIVLLNISKLLKAKVNKEYHRFLREASLILPVSKGIIAGIRFQKKGEATRYNPYEIIIKLLSNVESYFKGVYLLGSRIQDLIEAEKNIKGSFPTLKVIGRFSGYFKRKMENDIKTSIRKSAPAVILAGNGVKGKELWLYRNTIDFNPGISLWVDNYLDIFAGKDKNITKRMFNLGLESCTELFVKPWKFLLIFPYIYFKILVLIYKIIQR